MTSFFSFVPGAALAVLITSHAALAQALPVSSEIIDRDYDSAIQQNVYQQLNGDGTPVLVTNRFTILENNMHYFEDGQWKPSENVLEIFPGGLIGRRGPNRAIFSPTLNSPAVFGTWITSVKLGP